MTSIVMYVVYENRRDFPGKFVVRRWQNSRADPLPVIVCGSLGEARGAIPPGLYNLGRYVEDDPAIREVFL